MKNNVRIVAGLCLYLLLPRDLPAEELTDKLRFDFMQVRLAAERTRDDAIRQAVDRYFENASSLEAWFTEKKDASRAEYLRAEKKHFEDKRTFPELPPLMVPTSHPRRSYAYAVNMATYHFKKALAEPCRSQIAALEKIKAELIHSNQLDKVLMVDKDFQEVQNLWVPWFEFVPIPAGEFVMGSPKHEAWNERDEFQRKVIITNAFLLAKHEVTQGQWEAVMGSNPSQNIGRDLPVESMDWPACIEFLERLCVFEGLPKGTYRLPAEEEWEYACRAGTTDPFSGPLDEVAWYSLNSNQKSHPVGRLKPNSWGLYDMHGNVMEFCAVGYEEYVGIASIPAKLRNWKYICRGGYWNSAPELCRSAFRCNWGPGAKGAIGFRILMTK